LALSAPAFFAESGGACAARGLPPAVAAAIATNVTNPPNRFIDLSSSLRE
jgi:hypothetical protein